MIPDLYTSEHKCVATVGVSAGFEILDSFSAGVIVTDEKGPILYRNTAAQRLLPEAGTLAGTFAGGKLLGAFEDWDDVLTHVTEGGGAALVHCTLANARDHRTELLRVDCFPLRLTSSEGRNGMVLLVQPQMEPEGMAEPSDLTARLAALGKLAAGVAHELNNPLDGVLRYTNLALRIIEETREPRLKKYLSESRSGLIRMTQIVADLLEYSRATVRGFEYSDVNEVIEQAIQAHAASATAAGVVIAADYRSPEMPPVRGSRLYQVCGNLIRNAIDAMPDGGRLTITSAAAGDEVVIEVADTGVGLPEEAARIFEPFFTTKSPGWRIGIGLALCKEYVEEWRGTLTGAPASGGGAVFTVRIPWASLNAEFSRRGAEAAENCRAGDEPRRYK